MTRDEKVRPRVRDEHGQTLIVVMVIAVVGLLLALAVAGYAFQATQSGDTDQRTRNAQQASDAGVQQQLYEEASSDAVGYDLNGGPLGLGTLLDCSVRVVSSSGVTIGSISVAAGTGGACPSADQNCTVSTASGTLGQLTGCSSNLVPWAPLDDHDYAASEFFPNAEAQGSCSTSSFCDAVEFPTVVSIGCDTRAAAASAATDCNGSCTDPTCTGAGQSGDSYSRELAILDPTAPLQSIEGGNDVTLTGALTNSATLTTLEGSSGLTALISSINNIPLIGSILTTSQVCGLVTGGTLSVKIGIVNVTLSVGVLKTVYGIVTSAAEIPVCDVLTNLSGYTSGGVAVVDGNINAGYDLALPPITTDVNTSSSCGSSATSLTSLLGCQLGSLLSQQSLLGDVSSTFEFGNAVCPGTVTSSSCANTVPPTNVTAIGATFVNTGDNVCTAGKPSTACSLERQTFAVTSVPSQPNGATYDGVVLPSGMVYTGSTAGAITLGAASGSVNGKSGYDLTMTSGTLSFSPGTYVFCNVNIEGGDLTDTASGGVQIYVLSPTSPYCGGSSYSTSPSAYGNFVSCTGVSNALASTTTNPVDTLIGGTNLTNVDNASGFQIYVQGGKTPSIGTTDYGVTPPTACGSASGDPTTVNPSATPNTQVYIGDPALLPNGDTSPTEEALVVYAPESEVTINSSLAFEGSAVGYNVDITALSVAQDLDLNNNPLSSVINGYQVAQTVQCDNSREVLDPNDSTNFPNAEADDTKGC